jgi:hypothetical protein
LLNPETKRVFNKDFWDSPEVTQFTTNSYEAIFCILLDNKETLFKQFKVRYGLRALELIARPVQWTQVGENLHYGLMNTITVENEPDPDWLILKAATLRKDADNHSLIDIEIYNPTKSDSPGGDIALYLSNQESLPCPRAEQSEARPKVVEVPVKIRQQTCEEKLSLVTMKEEDLHTNECLPQVLSPDPGEARLVKRFVQYESGKCGKVWAVVNMGSTGQLSAGVLTKIRYVFDKEFHLESVGSQRRLQADRVDMADYFYMLSPYRIGVNGLNISPTDMGFSERLFQ